MENNNNVKKQRQRPKCPICGSEMRVIYPINMAICDKCNRKYYIEKVDDIFVVVGDYYEVKKEKNKQVKKEDEAKEEVTSKDEEAEEKSEPKQEIKIQEEGDKPETVEVKEEESSVIQENEPKPSVVQNEAEEETEIQEENVEAEINNIVNEIENSIIEEDMVQEVEEIPAEKAEKEVETEVRENKEEKKDIEPAVLKIAHLSHTDKRVLMFKEMVEKYVIQKYWREIAKEELKKMVSEMYDAGALGEAFNPTKVAKELISARETGIIHFYGLNWLDRLITKELLSRIWLRMQGYNNLIQIEKLRIYIAIFHEDELKEFEEGRMSEIKVRKYLSEMQMVETGNEY